MSNAVEFTTLNSRYYLDHVEETWTRVENNGVVDPLLPLRSPNGPMWSHSEIVVGERVIISGPRFHDEECHRLNAGTPAMHLGCGDDGTIRQIRTSAVVAIVHGDRSAWSRG